MEPARRLWRQRALCVLLRARSSVRTPCSCAACAGGQLRGGRDAARASGPSSFPRRAHLSCRGGRKKHGASVKSSNVHTAWSRHARVPRKRCVTPPRTQWTGRSPLQRLKTTRTALLRRFGRLSKRPLMKAATQPLPELSQSRRWRRVDWCPCTQEPSGIGVKSGCWTKQRPPERHCK